MNGENEKNVCNSRGSGRNAWRINGLCLQDYPGLNEELKAKGYRTICGKVPTKYFEEKFYGLTVAM